MDHRVLSAKQGVSDDRGRGAFAARYRAGRKRWSSHGRSDRLASSTPAKSLFVSCKVGPGWPLCRFIFPEDLELVFQGLLESRTAFAPGLVVLEVRIVVQQMSAAEDPEDGGHEQISGRELLFQI